MEKDCEIKWALYFSNDEEKALKAISTLTWMEGSTNTAAALGVAETELALGRQDADKVVVLFDHGVPTFSKELTKEAAESLKKIARLVVVPAGLGAPVTESKMWASSPSSENVIAVNGNEMNEDVKSVTNKILVSVCPVLAEVPAATEAPYVKVSGGSSCAAKGFEDFDGDANGCVAAAESTGYDFTITRKGGHKVPVIPDKGQTYKRTCVVCENMIYANRPNLLFWDKPKGETSCNQDGKQTKVHICKAS